jgi:hypothetical protein
MRLSAPDRSRRACANCSTRSRWRAVRLRAGGGADFYRLTTALSQASARDARPPADAEPHAPPKAKLSSQPLAAETRPALRRSLLRRRRPSWRQGLASLVTSRFPKMWASWVVTVSVVTNIRPAISAFVRPSSTSSTTVHSIGVELAHPVLRRRRRLRPRRAYSTASSIERPNSPLTKRPPTPSGPRPRAAPRGGCRANWCCPPSLIPRAPRCSCLRDADAAAGQLSGGSPAGAMLRP